MRANQTSGTLKVGIAKRETIARYVREVRFGRRRRQPDDPDVWFTSVESFAKILSQRNRDLLALIRERQPDSIEELALMSGRAKSNLCRTLHTMEAHGLVRLEKGKGRKLRPVVTFENVELRLAVAA